jgi:hypothetical protein
MGAKVYEDSLVHHAIIQYLQDIRTIFDLPSPAQKLKRA